MENELEKITLKISDEETEKTYKTVRGYVIDAQDKIYRSVNNAMVQAYWNIGKEIYEACGKNERTAFGIELDSL